MSARHRFVLRATLAAAFAASAPASRAQTMPGGDMHSADGAMSGDKMPMAHMTMTTLGPVHAGDEARAAAIADTLRGAIEKYRNYHVALDEGFVIFMPKIPQRVYHFTSRPNAFRSIFSFDPARPTSLLYRKTGGGYTLIGAMFTAPNRYGPKDLGARVPLSVAELLCTPIGRGTLGRVVSLLRGGHSNGTTAAGIGWTAAVQCRV